MKVSAPLVTMAEAVFLFWVSRSSYQERQLGKSDVSIDIKSNSDMAKCPLTLRVTVTWQSDWCWPGRDWPLGMRRTSWLCWRACCSALAGWRVAPAWGSWGSQTRYWCPGPPWSCCCSSGGPTSACWWSWWSWSSPDWTVSLSGVWMEV